MGRCAYAKTGRLGGNRGAEKITSLQLAKNGELLKKKKENPSLVACYLHSPDLSHKTHLENSFSIL
jgi:hypothetical protein